MLQEIKQHIGNIIGVHSEILHTDTPFPDLAGRFAHLPGTVLLMSGGDLDCTRHHILGINPWLTFSGRGRQMRIQAAGSVLSAFDADPFDTLEALLDAFRLRLPNLSLPLSAGLLGYLAYDLKDALEELPRTSVDDLCLPHIWFTVPSVLLIRDRQEKITRICVPEREGTDTSETLAAFRETLSETPPEPGPFRGSPGGFTSGFTRPAYMAAIRRIREYIAAGHVYQVNMSQRFEMDFAGDTFTLFRTLFEMNPAPFFAYINAGDHQIVSTSPERFILRQGRRVETRPIKGTRPRGKTPDADQALARELSTSKKDDAELSMIVDLMRNDIGKVCEAGSVRVTAHKRLEAWQNVWHLVSVAEGVLDADKNTVDLLRATFPGGSITGCPKIRSMEIIDELEPNLRHIYTGAIGYIGFHDTADLSIAIRTATVHNGRIVFSAGGGIVYDSDPADEYDETLHKGRTLMSAFQGEAGAPKAAPAHVWLNGMLRPLSEASLPLAHPGAQYGHGFFETIRVENGTPRYLAEHVGRFNAAWTALFPGTPPDLTWDEIIRQVIEKNSLGNQVAAVKIMAAKGDRTAPPVNHTLAVMARPYIHRLEGKTPSGLRLATYPHPRQTPLADHKTMNYLCYLRAGEWARDQGDDEALILNPDGSISETHTANLLLIRNRTVLRPASPHVLPGVMAQAVSRYLEKKGYNIVTRPLQSGDLYTGGDVLLTNSLMGVVPALYVDGQPLPPASGLWKKLNLEL
ncbi:aminodeoxychorismate synthase, component I [Desulfonema ishimotonii]|uniref:aminodeoxychorismate synthase n=1 Tax=Desulfonema ishimotonii TaxID=45657 RepID=A0A401G1W3_9BACT|nr:aminodeoxychorismate synthase component I [Desulfonema ishimotonii]GBC63204.1 aminodeoxychorismate synthase, component I [Desulfonema ishimotonii]